jgi:hypothetical protein
LGDRGDKLERLLGMVRDVDMLDLFGEDLQPEVGDDHTNVRASDVHADRGGRARFDGDERRRTTA